MSKKVNEAKKAAKKKAEKEFKEAVKQIEKATKQKQQTHLKYVDITKTPAEFIEGCIKKAENPDAKRIFEVALRQITLSKDIINKALVAEIPKPPPEPK